MTTLKTLLQRIKSVLCIAAEGLQGMPKNAVSLFRENKNVRICASVLLIFVLFLSSSEFIQIGYAVSLDGEKIGFVSSKEEANEIISNIETQASGILGEEISLSNRIRVASVLSGTDEATTPGEDIEKVVFDNVDKIELLYAVSLSGAVVAAVEDEQTANDVIAEITALFSNDTTFSASIVQAIKVEHTYANVSLIATKQELFDMLDPRNADSPYSVSVKTSYITEETEDIAYETVYIDDASMYTDQTKVLVPGVNGASENSYYSVYLNDEQIERTLMSSTITTPTVDEQIAVGTKQRPSTVSHGNYIWPTNGSISSYFGYRTGSVGSSNHTGIDIWGSYGQNICAADGGTVTFSGWENTGYGYLVIITHDNGEQTYYAHCSGLAVSAGERVFQGQTIAYMGASGRASGTHLHFEVRVGGTPVDPLSCL